MAVAGFNRRVIGTRWARCLVPVTVMIAVAIGIPSNSNIAQNGSTAEIQAFDRIYYTALLAGRDPEAALRKAHYTTNLLMKQFGMTRSEATMDVARFMVWRTGQLCGGG